jgi:hypothetical protein
MKLASHDRGTILDLAGANHLSPALRDGRPALVDESETAGRIGWESFFAVLDRAGLELSWDTEDAASVRAVPVAEARPLERHPTFADGLARTRRFVAALRGGPTPPATS